MQNCRTELVGHWISINHWLSILLKLHSQKWEWDEWIENIFHIWNDIFEAAGPCYPPVETVTGWPSYICATAVVSHQSAAVCPDTPAPSLQLQLQLQLVKDNKTQTRCHKLEDTSFSIIVDIIQYKSIMHICIPYIKMLWLMKPKYAFWQEKKINTSTSSSKKKLKLKTVWVAITPFISSWFTIHI